MKKRIFGFILTFTLALTVTGCATFSDPAAWDYKADVVETGPGTIRGDISRAEEQGWKLVSMKPLVDSSGNAAVILLYKKYE